MSQIPISIITYSRFTMLKAKAIIEKESSVTWEEVISSACDLCNSNEEEFIKIIRLKVGKKRKRETMKKKEFKNIQEVEESFKKGETVTSNSLEKIKKRRFKE